MTSVFGSLRRLVHSLWWHSVKHRFHRADRCRLYELELVVDPGVLHPAYFASSRVLARHLMGRSLEGQRVADIGTGSGLLALLAARAGARAIGIDANPGAAICAGRNAARNGLDSRARFVASDLLTALRDDTHFDMVVTNPPFYPRIARTHADLAFAAGRGHAFFTGLARTLGRKLTPNGSLVLIHSSDTDFAPIGAVLEAQNLVGAVRVVHRGLFETLTIREFRLGPT